MRLLTEEYFRSILAIICGVLSMSIVMLILLSSVYPKSVEAIKINVNDYKVEENRLPVSIGNFVVKDVVINKNDQLDIKNCVTAKNSKGEDISSFVTLVNDIDTSLPGNKEANYVLRYNGETMLGKAKIIVEEDVE